MFGEHRTRPALRRSHNKIAVTQPLWCITIEASLVAMHPFQLGRSKLAIIHHAINQGDFASLESCVDGNPILSLDENQYSRRNDLLKAFAMFRGPWKSCHDLWFGLQEFACCHD